MRGQGEGSDAEYEGDELHAAAAAAAWQPDPVDVDARRPARARRAADIISMLVAIYGSKELFIAEYRRALPLRKPLAVKPAVFGRDLSRRDQAEVYIQWPCICMYLAWRAYF